MDKLPQNQDHATNLVPDRPNASGPMASRRWPGDWVRLWFRVDRDVGPTEYAASGLGLMALKYSVEAGLIYAVTGKFFSPMVFLSPMLNLRQGLLGDAEWIGWFQFFWTLPFVWVAFSMSVRRAANAGLSPWLGVLALIPILNYVFMMLMSVRPTRQRVWSMARPEQVSDSRITSGSLAVLASLLLGLLSLGVSVYVARSYGATLFFGTPLLMGAVSGFVHNRNHSRSFGSTCWVGLLSMVVPGLVLIGFALEGAICILMAAPIVVPLSLIGAAVGKAIADYTTSLAREVVAVMLLVPILSGAESLRRPPPLREIVTSVEIAAPPERVWRHVVSFPELPAPREWYFRAGIACPTSAWIDGVSVGAVRHCVFSTGEFVEPITTWDEPQRLAFDVTEQPDPMRELSPYGEIHPPHLGFSMHSQRGEFLLIPLANGSTRLEGRTWYELEMFPQGYWTLWSDTIIHRIHRRVLTHIRSLCEND